MKNGRLHVVKLGLVALPSAWKKNECSGGARWSTNVAVPEEEPRKEAPLTAETTTS